MIHKVAKMTINSVRNNTNQANASGVQVQFADNPAGKTHQNLFSSQMIGIQHEEIPVLDPPKEPHIGTKNQPVLTTSNRDVSGSGTSSLCPIPPPCAPPSVIWNNSI